MQRLVRKGISAILVASMIAASWPISREAGARELTRAEYDSCRAPDDATFRSAVHAITRSALISGLDRIDYRAIVDNEWRRISMGELIDQRVDIAIAAVRRETTWGDLLKSLAYTEVSQKIALDVTERVYHSDAIKGAIDSLAVGVGREVGRSIEIATIDTAKPAVACIKAFLGPRYGGTVAQVVARDAGKEFEIDPAKGQAALGAGSRAIESSAGIAGAVILLVRRRLADMTARIGQRLVGSVLGRLVSVVAGGVGVVLIAKDVWEMRSGVLPIIAQEMKSNTTKDKVKAELASTIAEQIRQQTDDIASATADRIGEIWRDFRRGHQKVLELADKNAGFRSFLDAARPGDLARVDEVVGLVLAGEGETGVLRRLADGTLERAVTGFSEEGMQVARDTQSLETATLWHALAGERLASVIEYGLHKRAKPRDFTPGSLARLFALGDALVVTRLAEVPPSARDSLFELPDATLVKLSRSLGGDELATLSGYLGGLEPSARKQVLTAVAATPARMRVLAVPRVRDAVLASKDQQAAVRMMLEAPPVFDLDVLRMNLSLVLDGRVSPILIWEKHPIAIAAGVLALLMVLLILRRLTSRRPPAAAVRGDKPAQ